MRTVPFEVRCLPKGSGSGRLATAIVFWLAAAAPVGAQVQSTVQLPAAPHAVGEKAGYFVDPETGQRVYRLTDPIICPGASGGRHEYSYTTHFSKMGRIVARCAAAGGLQRFPVFDSSYTLLMTDALTAANAPPGVAYLQWSQTEEVLYGRGSYGKVYKLDPFAGTTELVADFQSLGAIAPGTTTNSVVHAVQTMYLGAGDRIVVHLQNSSWKVIGIGSFDPATRQYAAWPLSGDPDGSSFDEAAPTQHPAGRIHVMAPSKLFSWDFSSQVPEGGRPSGHYGFLTLSDGRTGVVKGWSDATCSGGDYRYEFAIVDDETGQPIVKFGCELPQQIAWNHWGRSVGAPDTFSLSTDRWTYAPSNAYASTHEAIIQGVVNYVGSSPDGVTLRTVAHHRSAYGPRSRALGRDCGYWASARAAIDHSGRRFMFDSTMSHPEWPAIEIDGTLKTTCGNDVYVAEMGPEPVTITTSEIPPGTVGVAYESAISVHGGTDPKTWAVVQGALPAGLWLDAGSGVIAGTPAEKTTATFTAHVHDANWDPLTGSATKELTLVTAWPPVQVLATSLSDGMVGVPYKAAVQATGGNGSYSWSVVEGSLPGGITLNAQAGLFSGVPTGGGFFTFTVRASDSEGNRAERSFSAAIAWPPLHVQTEKLSDGTVGTPYSVAVQATGGTGIYAWSVSGGSLPVGLSLNPATGAIEGVPSVVGQYAFTLLAKDSAGQADSQGLSLTVRTAHVVLKAAADAYVRGGSYASSNFGTAFELVSKLNGSATYQRESYLKFNVAGIGIIGTATLRLFGRLSDDRAAEVPTAVHAAATSWSESTLNWNNRPASGASPIGAFTVAGTVEAWHEVDVTAFVRAEKAAGRTTIGFALKALADTLPYASWRSREAAGNQPELVVTSSVSLAPSGDTYVRGGSWASSNFGSGAELIVKTNDDPAYHREAYVEFDLSGAGGVGSATLRLYGRLSDGRHMNVQTAVYSVAPATWQEDTLSWNNRPTPNAMPLGVVTVADTTERWHELDLTSFVRAELAAGRKVVSLVLRGVADALPYTSFNSRNAVAYQPQLFLR